jgi:hypothetical protein
MYKMLLALGLINGAFAMDVSVDSIARQSNAELIARDLAEAMQVPLTPEPTEAPERLQQPEWPQHVERQEQALENIDSAENTSLKTAPLRRVQPRDELEQLHAQNARKKYIMRCWQEGRLILQRSLARLPQSAAAQSVELDQGDGVSIQLFDLRNATCLVQKQP